MSAQTAKMNKSITNIKILASDPLRFKNRKKLPIHRLPFVGKVPGVAGLSFWDVPKTGNYLGGTKTGEALARVYLKFVKEHGECGLLRSIALDMFEAKRNCSPERDALRGQVVGFFFVLERWLEAATKNLDGGLDKMDTKDLLKAANAGLDPNYEPDWSLMEQRPKA